MNIDDNAFDRYDIDLLQKGTKPFTPKPVDDELPLDLSAIDKYSLPTEKKETEEACAGKDKTVEKEADSFLVEKPTQEMQSATEETIDPDFAPPPPFEFPEEKNAIMAAMEKERLEALALANAIREQMEPVATTHEDIEKTAQKTKKIATATQEMTDRLTELIAGRHRQLPKGVRSTVRRMSHATEYLIATTLLTETLAETDNQKAFDIIGKSKFMSVVSANCTIIEMQLEELTTLTDTLTEVLDGGNADKKLTGRQMFNTAEKIETNATDIIKAASEGIQQYPDEYGELALFMRIAAKGDEQTMTIIDHALHRVGEQLICVADAHAMITAMKESDRDTQVTIIKRMIEDIPVTKSRATA